MVVCRDSGPRIIISCHIKNDTFINNSYANKLLRFSLCANNLFHGSLGLHAPSLSKEGGWVNEVDKVHEVKRQKVSSDSIIYSFLWIPHLLSRNWRLKGTWFHYHPLEWYQIMMAIITVFYSCCRIEWGDNVAFYLENGCGCDIGQNVKIFWRLIKCLWIANYCQINLFIRIYWCTIKCNKTAIKSLNSSKQSTCFVIFVLSSRSMFINR